nr:MAG TPA: hypothetical protein [Caudoviricetes sp.]
MLNCKHLYHLIYLNKFYALASLTKVLTRALSKEYKK